MRISTGVFGFEKMRKAFVRKHVSSAPVDGMHQIVSRKKGKNCQILKSAAGLGNLSTKKQA